MTSRGTLHSNWCSKKGGCWQDGQPVSVILANNNNNNNYTFPVRKFGVYLATVPHIRSTLKEIHVTRQLMLICQQLARAVEDSSPTCICSRCPSHRYQTSLPRTLARATLSPMELFRTVSVEAKGRRLFFVFFFSRQLLTPRGSNNVTGWERH